MSSPWRDPVVPRAVTPPPKETAQGPGHYPRERYLRFAMPKYSYPAEERRTRRKLLTRAQGRAARVLTRRYPNEYRVLFRDECARLFTEAGLTPPQPYKSPNIHWSPETCGSRLKTVREAAKISPLRLAIMMGLPLLALEHIESDDRAPLVAEIARAAEALNVDPAWLAFGEATVQ